MHRRTLVGALPALAILKSLAQEARAAAAGGRKYVCLSLVANELQYVQPAAQTVGHNLQHSEVTVEPAGRLHLDEAALVAMNEALDRCSAKGAPRSFLVGSEPAFFEDQYDWFSGGRLTLPPKLAQSVAGEHGTHLVLLTKHLGNAEDIKTVDFGENLGRGRVSGVGIYRDPDRAGVIVGGDHDGEQIGGFVAPFVSVQLSLVDLASGRVLGQKAAMKARALGRSSQAARLMLLQDEIQQAVRETLPPLVDAS